MSERSNSRYKRLGIYEYDPSDILGSGAFAVVYRGRFHDNKRHKVAIKIMIKGQNVLKSKTLLSKEISVLKDLNHEHIVRLYDHCISNTDVYLVMEFCNGGDLSAYLHSKKTLPEETIRHFLSQIGSAMDSMNRRAIMHRDLKPGNILLSFYGNHASVNDVPGPLLTFKLADFGFARFLQDGIMAETMCGSPMYMAPEVLMCRKYDAKADIWSMGIIVYQCFVGKAPFYANSPEALKNIYLKTVDLKPKIPREASANLRDLLLQMLIRNPPDRIDFPDFLSHPFLTEKHIEPSDLCPHKPASVPPLPISVRQPRNHANAATNRTYVTPALLSDRRAPTNKGAVPATARRAPGAIADLMPVKRVIPGLGSRLIPPTTVRPCPPKTHVQAAPSHTLPPPPPAYNPALDNNDDSSEASLTPTEDGDEFIEDGLGGSSFLVGTRVPHQPLSTDGLSDLGRCLPDVLRNRGGNDAHHLCHRPLIDKSMEGYVVVEPDNETHQTRIATKRLQNETSSSKRSEQPSPPQHTTNSPPTSANVPRWSLMDDVGLGGLRGNQQTVSGSSIQQTSSDANLYTKEQSANGKPRPGNTCLKRSQTTPEAYSALAQLQPPATDVSPDLIAGQEHKTQMDTITMVLELCELLNELAERRAAALADCTTTPSPLQKTATVDSAGDSSGSSSPVSSSVTPNKVKTPTKLKLVPESTRIVEQLVLYRRILYYLKYVFEQVKDAVAHHRLKPTENAKKTLTECNALYHRCYIRLCQLSRQSRREDLLEPVGRLLSRVTANRLIFHYALDQCYAAEMDDYMGDLGLAIRRYKAAITLIHGLCQHAESPSDKQLLSECLRMIRERHVALLGYVSNGDANVRGFAPRGLSNNIGESPPSLATTLR